MILHIALGQQGKEMFVSGVFTTKKQAKQHKKIMSKDYPKAKYQISKIRVIVAPSN